MFSNFLALTTGIHINMEINTRILTSIYNDTIIQSASTNAQPIFYGNEAMQEYTMKGIIIAGMSTTTIRNNRNEHAGELMQCTHHTAKNE